MIFAKFIINDKETVKLYDSWLQYNHDTFNPLTEHISLIEFKLHGRNYHEKKESLRNIAIEWSIADSSGISYGELSYIENWFEVNGKRYGLIEDLHENGIC